MSWWGLKKRKIEGWGLMELGLENLIQVGSVLVEVSHPWW